MVGPGVRVLQPGAAQSGQGSLRLDVHDDVAPLYEAWSTLERSCPDATIFQSADWCLAWVEAARAAGASECPRILTIWRGERLVLLWPLAIRRLSGFRILHALAEPATQYGDLLIEPEEDRGALVEIAWQALCSWRDVDAIELRRVRNGSVLAALPALRSHAVERSRESAPLLDFDLLAAGGAEAQRTSRSRNALRRHQRLLSQFGKVEFEIVEGAQAQRAALAEAFALKRAWQTHKAMASLGYAHRASEGCLLRLADEGALLAARLRVGGQTAALEIGALRHRRYWSLVQSYDLRFAKHAPGRLLFWHLLGKCPELGIAVFDFLAPACRHKLEWSNTEIGIRDYLVPVSLRGRVAVSYLGAVKPRLRAVYGRLPGGVRSQLAWLLPSLS